MNSGDINWQKKTKKIKGVKHTAVLYSPTFGAGWSTWNKSFASFLLFDKGIVERVLKEDKESIKAYVTEKTGGTDSVYFGGLRDLEVAWIPEGERFVIDEYDGRESIRFLDDVYFFTA